MTVEGGGTGIPLIIREMASRALGEPKFEASPDRFTVTLARYGVEYQQNHQWLEHLQTGLDRHEQTILLMLRRQGTMNVEQLHTSLRIDSDDIRKILTILIAKGLVRNSDNGAYTLTNDNTTSAGVEPLTLTRSDTLTVAERQLLKTLSPSEAMSARKISEMTDRSLPSVRKLLRRLVGAGMVIATAPPSSKNRQYKRAS